MPASVWWALEVLVWGTIICRPRDVIVSTLNYILAVALLAIATINLFHPVIY